jgi:Rod binding domain-containing protein
MTISINPTGVVADSVKTENSAASVKSARTDSLNSARMEGAIEKFEGLFLSMIIKELRETDTGGGLFAGEGSDTYGGLFDTFMGDHLAESSDTGIEQLFRSPAAKRQLEDYVNPQLTAERRSKGIEEYRNEQFRSGAVAAPASP